MSRSVADRIGCRDGPGPVLLNTKYTSEASQDRNFSQPSAHLLVPSLYKKMASTEYSHKNTAMIRRSRFHLIWPINVHSYANAPPPHPRNLETTLFRIVAPSIASARKDDNQRNLQSSFRSFWSPPAFSFAWCEARTGIPHLLRIACHDFYTPAWQLWSGLST